VHTPKPPIGPQRPPRQPFTFSLSASLAHAILHPRRCDKQRSNIARDGTSGCQKRRPGRVPDLRAGTALFQFRFLVPADRRIEAGHDKGEKGPAARDGVAWATKHSSTVSSRFAGKDAKASPVFRLVVTQSMPTMVTGKDHTFGDVSSGLFWA
jgi:hypothetical protein